MALIKPEDETIDDLNEGQDIKLLDTSLAYEINIKTEAVDGDGQDEYFTDIPSVDESVLQIKEEVVDCNDANPLDDPNYSIIKDDKHSFDTSLVDESVETELICKIEADTENARKLLETPNFDSCIGETSKESFYANEPPVKRYRAVKMTPFELAMVDIAKGRTEDLNRAAMMRLDVLNRIANDTAEFHKKILEKLYTNN